MYFLLNGKGQTRGASQVHVCDAIVRDEIWIDDGLLISGVDIFVVGTQG